MAGKRFRIFVSSPSDVFAERERLERVIARLDGEFGGNLLEAIRWESSYYSAAKTFQDQIPLPSQTDLVVCMFWKRLGFELPPDYRRPDGTTPTGTEYEFEDAITAARTKGEPDVLVYRKIAPVLLSAEQVEMEQAQLAALKHFWGRWFQTEAGNFTAAYQTFDSTDAFERQVEDHIRQWLARRSVAASGLVWPIAERGSPFRGLLAFESRHAEIFFGRRRIIERARERLVDAAAAGSPFLLVLGTSGSGKSSLARAGLLPRIMQPGAAPGVDLWRACTLRPSEGDTPFDALARALYAPARLPELASGDCPTPADLAQLLATAPDAAARTIRLALDRAAAPVAARESFDRPVQARLLLLVDQFEEALRDPTRDAFGRALQALVATGTVWIVATLRSDLYALFQVSPPLMALRDTGALLDLIPPGPAEITEIITGPAAAAGLHFDCRPDGVGLDEELARAAGPGELPLLQLALQALFEARDPATGMLTFAAYDALGGLSGVVERRAETTLAALDPDAQAALAATLRSLVDVTDTGAVTSRPAPPPADPAAARLVDAFVTARLLVIDAQDHQPLVRVAHESLLSGWPRAATLLAADRDTLRTRGRVEAATARWRAEAANAEFLLPPGRPLAEAVELANQRPDMLDTDGLAFVAASRAADEARAAAAAERAQRELRLQAEAQQARADAASRVVHRTRVAVGVVSALLVVAAGTAVFATQQRHEALAQSAEARRQEAAAERQRSRAETNFAVALNGNAKLMDAVSAHLRDGGMTRTVSRALLDDASGALDQLGAETTPTPPLLDARARLQASLSTVQRATCDGDGARLRATEAVRLADAAWIAEPTPARSAALVQRLDTLGQAEVENENYPAADAAYRRAEAAAGAAPETPALLSVRRNRGFLALAQNDFPLALDLLRTDAAGLEQRLAATPDNVELLDLLATDRRLIAFALIGQHRDAEALPVVEQTDALAQRLTASAPDNVAWQRLAATTMTQRAEIAAATGDPATALDLFAKTAAIADRIAARDRANGDWQQDAVQAANRWSGLLRRQGRMDEARQVLLPAVVAVDALDRPGANSAHCRSLGANMRSVLGYSLFYSGANTDAARQFERTAAMLAEAGDAKLADRQSIEKWTARAYAAATDTPHAIQHANTAVELARRLIERDPNDLAARTALSDARLDLADSLAKSGDVDAAVVQYETNAADAALMSATHPGDLSWQHLQVTSHLRAAAMFNTQKRIDDQWDALQRAKLAARREIAAAPLAADSQADLIETLQTMVLPMLIRGEGVAAIVTARESVALAETFQTAMPQEFRARQRLAFALFTLGIALKATNQIDEASTVLDRAQKAMSSLQTALVTSSK